jgi:hypothetical protein
MKTIHEMKIDCVATCYAANREEAADEECAVAAAMRAGTEANASTDQINAGIERGKRWLRQAASDRIADRLEPRRVTLAEWLGIE